MLETADNLNLNAADWDAWLDRLQNRQKRSYPYEALAGFTDPPLSWCAPQVIAEKPTSQLLGKLHAIARSGPAKESAAAANLTALAMDWIDQVEQRDNLALGYESIAWADAAPRIAKPLGRETWIRLVAKLCELAEQAEVGRIEGPLQIQLFAGELPYTLAAMLSGVDRCDALAEPAVDVMSRTIQHETDGEGLPQATKLELFRPLLASWTRCQLRSDRGQFALDEDGQAQYEWAVSQFLRLTRFDGRQVLTDGSTGDWAPDFATALLTDIGDREDHAAARSLLPSGKRVAKAESKTTKIDRQPTVYSEWSELVVMRPQWKKQACQWSNRLDGRGVRSELSLAKTLLWQGEWTTRIRADDSTLAPASDWEEVCWTEDADANYLELEMQLEGGWRLQRQLLLALEDQVLLMADAVLGPESAALEYETLLPVGEDITFRGRDETNDGRLLSRKQALTHVLPLAFPEWRAERTDGALRNTVNGLSYEVHGRGPALYAPLFFDLNPTRAKQEATWRRLTVASKLEIEPRDRAVGYRVQVGAKQWLIYRSLTDSTNRTIFGQNLTCEFIFGRIDRHGDVENLVEVE